MTAVVEQTAAWLEQFTKQAPAAGWVQQLREEAFQTFSRLGFPTTHDEEWRFTNVAPIARTAWTAATNPTATANPTATNPTAINPSRDREGATSSIPEEARPHLGKYAPQNAFTALNTAFLSGVTYVHVPRGQVLEQPIEIAFEASENQAAYHPRVVIVIGANAQCTITETYKGKGRYFTNAVTEILVGEGAVVDHYKVELESPEAYHVHTLQAQLGRSANFSSHSISLGGALVRNDAGLTLSEGSEGTLNGLYIATGNQHVDNHTAIDHAKPHANSHELYKGILDGKANAVFNGRIIVRKDAQKTDSKQTNKNLVLSDEAVINTKPELQILADDVRCTHGATIGQLDAESLFYLRSRGIPKNDARNLLILAFAQDIVDRIKVPALRESLEKVLFEKLHEHSR